MMRAIATIALVVLSACADATGTRARNPTASTSVDPVAHQARLERQLQEQSARITELEARLALLEKEGRDLRTNSATIADVPPPKTPAVDPFKLVAASERLAVVPLPDERADKVRASSSAEREQYSAALRLVKEGRFADALPALARFLAQHPHDELADNARYWRGEVHYSERRYEQAIADFQGVLVRYPGSDTAPNCLLKIGMSHLRLGRRAEASRYFEQVIEQYPKSDAARAAANEGSS
jgi:tol-pal system protein YbgF